jgi:serine/threonine protein kinase
VRESALPSTPLSFLPHASLSLPHRAASLDEGVIRKYTKQILHALLYLHSHHIAHRNLKLTNILISNDGKILLSDYGG